MLEEEVNKFFFKYYKVSSSGFGDAGSFGEFPFGGFGSGGNARKTKKPTGNTTSGGQKFSFNYK